MHAPISVILPVYNAFNEPRACLESILRHTPPDVRIMVIDDASNEGNFAEFLGNLKNDSRIQLSRNPGNLGFVKTCNQGMRQAGHDDVVLINSDTLVTKNWISKLQRAAYSRSKVGTVTPLSNNATICSVPNFGIENKIPEGYTADSFGDLVEQVSGYEYPELPTCIGFCLYIKRIILDKVGLFDEEVFGRGYGEENDLSCRLQRAGFVDILDDSTFVFHKGNVSFSSAKAALVEKNSAALRSRHPHYFEKVQQFCLRSPLSQVRRRIVEELLRRAAAGKKNILHLLHNGPWKAHHFPPGGTERHVQDLIDLDKTALHWSLVPKAGYYVLTPHLDELDYELMIPRSSQALQRLIDNDFFTTVHLHHTLGFDVGVLSEVLPAHGDYIVSLHDFNLICPRFHLLTTGGQHCTGVECVSACSQRSLDIEKLRASSQMLLSKARTVIAFSQSTRSYYQKILNTELLIVGHGIRINGEQQSVKTRPDSTSPLKIVFVGFVGPHKGAALIHELTEVTQIGDLPVEWHLIGEFIGEKPSKLIQHGSYKRDEINAKIRALAPHIGAILSICPETYSYTLDELWSSGIPVISTPLGAPGERIAKLEGGWVLPELTAATFLRTLESIVNNWQDYERVSRNLAGIRLTTVEEEIAVYSELYASSSNVVDINKLFAEIQVTSVLCAIKPSLLRRVIRRGLSELVLILERLRVRNIIQGFVMRIVPPNIWTSLKGLR